MTDYTPTLKINLPSVYRQMVISDVTRLEVVQELRNHLLSCGSLRFRL